MGRTARAGTVWLVALAVILVAGCGGGTNKAGGGASKSIDLVLADTEDGTTNAQPFADAVDRLSHGAIHIDIKSPWRAHDTYFDADTIRDVRSGKAALGVASVRGFGAAGITSFDALQAPLLIDSTRLEQKVFDSDIARAMLKPLRGSGLVGLTLLAEPLQRPLGFGVALRSAADYRGRRIGIQPSTVTAQILRALGATPVVLPRGGASASGLAGVVSDAASIESGWAIPGATLTGNVILVTRPKVVFANRKTFDALSSTQRRILVEAAARARSAGVYTPDEGPLASLCQRNTKIVQASSADLRGLAAASARVDRALEANPSTRAFIARITSMRRALGAPPAALHCPAASLPAASGPQGGSIVGTWEVTFSRRDLQAAHPVAGELMPANWGHFTLTFRNGTFSETGTGPNSSASGGYVARGNKIVFHRHDHAYTGSDTEVWGPYTWSVYRDTLTFNKITRAYPMPTSLRRQALAASGELTAYERSASSA